MTDYSELKRRAETAAIYGNDVFGIPSVGVKADQLLALIAENERLQEAHEQICTNYNQVSYASEERGKQIQQIKAEVEALRKDAERLEFMQDKGISVLANEASGGFSGPAGREWNCYKYGKSFSAYGKKLRDAIDAAMSKEPGQ